MAVNSTRSCNADLAEGMSDASFKKVVADRGGVVDAATYAARAQLDDLYYGIHEAGVKHLPDGTFHATPDFEATPAPSMQRW